MNILTVKCEHITSDRTLILFLSVEDILLTKFTIDNPRTYTNKDTADIQRTINYLNCLFS